MKIFGLDGREYSFTPKTNSHPKLKPSKLHNLAKTIIEESFPYQSIYEEVTLPGFGAYPLCADFFVTPNIVIEVQGEQHYKFNNFFYSSKAQFLMAKKRDRDKKEWCELNQIVFVELPYHESVDEWKSRIDGRPKMG